MPILQKSYLVGISNYFMKFLFLFAYNRLELVALTLSFCMKCNLSAFVIFQYIISFKRVFNTSINWRITACSAGKLTGERGRWLEKTKGACRFVAKHSIPSPDAIANYHVNRVKYRLQQNFPQLACISSIWPLLFKHNENQFVIDADSQVTESKQPENWHIGMEIRGI